MSGEGPHRRLVYVRFDAMLLENGRCSQPTHPATYDRDVQTRHAEQSHKIGLAGGY